MSVGGSGVVCAFAIPGTAINAPPASAAAEPVRNLLRESGPPCTVCATAWFPSVMVLLLSSILGAAGAPAALTLLPLVLAGPVRPPSLAGHVGQKGNRPQGDRRQAIP